MIVLLPFPLAFFSDFSEKQSLVIALTQGKGRFKKRVHFTRYPANSLLDRASDFLLQSYKNLDHKAGFKQAIDIDEVKKPLSIPVSFFRKLGIEVLFFRKLEVYKEAKQVTVELLRKVGGCLKVLKTFHFYLRSITSWEYKDLIIFQMPYKLVFGKQPEKA